MLSPNKSAAALALVALAGCAAGPDFKRPAAPTVQTYSMKSDAAGPQLAAPAAGGWWRAFGSDDLNQVMDEALKNNLDLAIADARLKAARADESADRGGAWPQVNANASAVRERINTTAFGITGFPSPTISLYSVGGAVAYDPDLFGARKRRVERSKARAEAEARRAEAAYLTLTGRVATQAFRIASLRAKLVAAQSVVTEDKSNVDLLQRAERAGGSSRTASTSADAQLADDIAALAPIQRDLGAARHQLALLVGKAPGEWTAPDFELSAFTAPMTAPATLPSDLVRSRPDILAAEADLHAATADVGVATAALYPSLSLSASLTQGSLTTTDLFARSASGWIIGPSLTAPIFHGGTLRAQRRASKARAAGALATYRKTVLEAFVQVADVMDALARDDEELNARVNAEKSAAARLDQTRQGFRRGGLAYLDVLDAQREHDRATQSLVDARGRRLADFALLDVALAANWRDQSAAR